MWASNWVSLGISVFRLPEWLVLATWGVVFFEVDFLRAGWGAMGGVGFFGAISAGARVLGWAALKGASFVFRLPETFIQTIIHPSRASVYHPKRKGLS